MDGQRFVAVHSAIVALMLAAPAQGLAQGFGFTPVASGNQGSVFDSPDVASYMLENGDVVYSGVRTVFDTAGNAMLARTTFYWIRGSNTVLDLTPFGSTLSPLQGTVVGSELRSAGPSGGLLLVQSTGTDDNSVLPVGWGLYSWSVVSGSPQLSLVVRQSQQLPDASGNLWNPFSEQVSRTRTDGTSAFSLEIGAPPPGILVYLVQSSIYEAATLIPRTTAFNPLPPAGLPPGQSQIAFNSNFIAGLNGSIAFLGRDLIGPTINDTIDKLHTLSTAGDTVLAQQGDRLPDRPANQTISGMPPFPTLTGAFDSAGRPEVVAYFSSVIPGDPIGRQGIYKGSASRNDTLTPTNLTRLAETFSTGTAPDLGQLVFIDPSVVTNGTTFVGAASLLSLPEGVKGGYGVLLEYSSSGGPATIIARDFERGSQGVQYVGLSRPPYMNAGGDVLFNDVFTVWWKRPDDLCSVRRVLSVYDTVVIGDKLVQVTGISTGSPAAQGYGASARLDGRPTRLNNARHAVINISYTELLAGGGTQPGEAVLAVELTQCSIADITGPGGSGGFPVSPDGQLTIEDFLTFLEAYGDPVQLANDVYLADVVALEAGCPDGQVTIEDFLSFLSAFGEGCAQ